MFVKYYHVLWVKKESECVWDSTSCRISVVGKLRLSSQPKRNTFGKKK